MTWRCVEVLYLHYQVFVQFMVWRGVGKDLLFCNNSCSLRYNALVQHIYCITLCKQLESSNAAQITQNTTCGVWKSPFKANMTNRWRYVEWYWLTQASKCANVLPFFGMDRQTAALSPSSSNPTQDSLPSINKGLIALSRSLLSLLAEEAKSGVATLQIEDGIYSSAHWLHITNILPV